MNIIHCKTMCRRLEQELRINQRVSVRVLSRYSHAVNLELNNGRLISCMASGRGDVMVPYGMIVSGDLEQGMFEEGRESMLALSPSVEQDDVWILDISGAEIRDMRLGMGMMPDEGWGTVRETVGAYLRNRSKERGIGEALRYLKEGKAAVRRCGYEEISQQLAAKRLQSFLGCLARLRPEDGEAGAGRRCPNILGMGVGLTPSSDDFVLGLLAVFQYTGDARQRWLEEFVAFHLQTTTRISREMLEHGISGEYPSYILEFFRGAAQGQVTGEMLDVFYNHGHSSGLDTLHGIYMGLKLMAE